MRTLYKSVYVLGAVLALSACKPAPKSEKVELPDFKQIFHDSLKGMVTCDKKESEVAIPDVPTDDQLLVEAEIENKDIETVNCEGQVTNKRHGPDHNLAKSIEITAPKDLKESVRYIEVENERTCSKNLFNASDINLSQPDPAESNSGILAGSKAERSGNMKLLVSDSTVILALYYLNVADGKNPLKITYYGKCRQYDAKKDPKDVLEFVDCKEPEILGTKQLVLKLDVKRPEVAGAKQILDCPKPK